MTENPYISPDDPGHPRRAKKGIRPWVVVLALLGIGGLAFLLLLPAKRGAREAARRNLCINNLKQIAVALHTYHDVYKALPPAYTVDADGKPLHSWRTLILPFMEEQALYKKIDLTKPWDDPANAAVFRDNMSVFSCPSADVDPNLTTYLALVGDNACFRATQPRKLSEIIDGMSKTLMVIEVPQDQAVPWMAPQDADEELVLKIGFDSKLAHSVGFNGVFGAGNVVTIPADVPAKTRRALITINGQEKVETEF